METEKSNMATRWPFWKWHCWKSIGSFSYTQVMCHGSLDLIFKAKLKLESGNQKIEDGHQAAILRVTSLKINKLLPMATNNMHIKFEIEIPKQTWVMLRKSCCLQTDGQTDRRTRWIQYTPQSTSLGGGINIPPLVLIMAWRWPGAIIWTNDGLMHICVTLPHWVRIRPSHYLNQCWIIVNWTIRNKFQWNHNQNTTIFIQANELENLSMPLTNWGPKIAFSCMKIITFQFKFQWYVRMSLTNNKTSLIQVKAWYKMWYKPLSEPMLT